MRHRRLVIAASAAQLAAQQNDPHTTAILKKLEAPISMSFASETPLEDVLKYIKQATTVEGPQGKPGSPGIPIYVDPKGLKEAEVELSAPVMLESGRGSAQDHAPVDLEATGPGLLRS